MAHNDNLFIRSGTYYGRYFEGGKLVRVSLDTADLEEAKARVAIKIARASMAKFGRITASQDEVIYFIHDQDLGMVKVGISRKLDSRFRSLKANTASDVVLLGAVAGSRELEKVLHRFLAPFHHRREWFRATEPVIAFVRSLIELERFNSVCPNPVTEAGLDSQKPLYGDA